MKRRENRRWPGSSPSACLDPDLSTIGVFGDELDAVGRLYFVPHGLFDGLPIAALLAGDPPAESMTFQEMRAAKLPWVIRRTAINMLPPAACDRCSIACSDGSMLIAVRRITQGSFAARISWNVILSAGGSPARRAAMGKPSNRPWGTK